MDFVAPLHVESSKTRDQTHVPCIGRHFLIQYTTRGVPMRIFNLFFFFLRPLYFYLLSYLATPHGMWILSFLTGESNLCPSSRRAEF